ncbi:hypothetical protein M9Y10_039103 [Tritrichomonas musculus]|uniref:CCZ1/INTU/HSP4 first Longin domain-containing protein n=1 Tax=Tritrichomonas musculus TaxID=1915356 RepID=A0ABR2KAY3_9EUKA
MNDLTSNNLLYSFFIFDSTPPTGEGSAPEIYYYFCNDPAIKNDKIYQLNQIGYILAFMTFCRQFSTDLPLDYIFTKNHEYSLLQLSGTVWMGVVLESKTPENRALLNSILNHFRNMFSSYFCPLTNSEEEVPKKKVLKALKVAFPSILKSVDWSRLDFRYLFNSYISQPFKIDMTNICREFLQNNSNIFDNIVIMYRHNRIIYSSFDPSTTRTLAFSMRRRFDHLFLHNPQRETEMLTWMIGLYINKSGFNSIYQQPIFLDGAPHLLVAFRVGYFKIVLTQPPDIEVSEEMLSSIPKRLLPIQQFLDKKNIYYPQKNVPIPFAAATNSYAIHKLAFNTSDLDAVSDSRLDRYFIKSHESAASYDRTATIAEPELGHSFIRCQRKIVNGQMEEELIFSKPPLSSKGISEKLKIFSYAMKSTEKESKDSSCAIA